MKHYLWENLMYPLKIERLMYEKLGLRRNPFSSICNCSDYEIFYSETYVKREFNALRRLLMKNCRPNISQMAIYVLGDHGCGKSTLFRNFVRKFSSNRLFLPIYCRFPFYGGLAGLYNEVMKRIHPSLLRKLTIMVKTKYPVWPPTYFLRKARLASFSPTEWEMKSALRISGYYAVEAFQDLVSTLLWVTKCNKIVLFLDDLEHTWIRLTGPQRYRWEETLTRIIPTLKKKLVLILPLNPTVLAASQYSSRPYFGMYNWTGINLDHYIKFQPNAALVMRKREEEVLALALEIASNAAKNYNGKRFCQKIINSLPKPLGSASEVLQRLYFEIRRAARGS
jgi:hypothetical protein